MLIRDSAGRPPAHHAAARSTGCYLSSAAFVNGRREAQGIFEREFAHVLPANADEFGDIRQAGQVGTDLDELDLRDCAFYVCECADNSLFGRDGLAREIQRDASRLTDANDGIIAACFTEAFDELVSLGDVCCEFELQGEFVFHHYSSSWLGSPSPALSSRLRVVQLSTTRLSCRA
jgi:hypothetical protein